MSLEKWEKLFRSDARSGGERYFAQQTVSVSRPSDNEIRSFIKGPAGLRISLTSITITSPLIVAQCTCAQFEKGLLCKHIWASLLMAEKMYPDFLLNKNEIETKEINKNSVFKEKQAAYRKQQYQIQKKRLKSLKESKSKQEIKYPDAIQQALNYFDTNGFKISTPINAEEIQFARKKLSRVFHPDKGGTHEEIVELNKNSEILLTWVYVIKT